MTDGPTGEETVPAPEETAPAAAAQAAAAAAAAGDTPAETEKAAEKAAEKAGLSPADAKVLAAAIVDELDSRGLFDRPPAPAEAQAAAAAGAAEAPVGTPPVVEAEPPRKYSLAERFRGAHKHKPAA